MHLQACCHGTAFDIFMSGSGCSLLSDNPGTDLAAAQGTQLKASIALLTQQGLLGPATQECLQLEERQKAEIAALDAKLNAARSHAIDQANVEITELTKVHAQQQQVCS